VQTAVNITVLLVKSKIMTMRVISLTVSDIEKAITVTFLYFDHFLLFSLNIDTLLLKAIQD